MVAYTGKLDKRMEENMKLYKFWKHQSSDPQVIFETLQGAL